MREKVRGSGWFGCGRAVNQGGPAEELGGGGAASPHKNLSRTFSACCVANSKGAHSRFVAGCDVGWLYCTLWRTREKMRLHGRPAPTDRTQEIPLNDEGDAPIEEDGVVSGGISSSVPRSSWWPAPPSGCRSG